MFTALYAAQSIAHVCILKKRPITENLDIFKWSLLSLDRCFCSSVVAPIRLDMTLDQGYACQSTMSDSDVLLWFTDDPGPLTLRENWTPDQLDILLDREAFCCKFYPLYYV